MAENTIIGLGVCVQVNCRQDAATDEYLGAYALIETVRRFYRNGEAMFPGGKGYDLIPLYTRTKEVIKKGMKNLKVGDVVFYIGSLSTRDDSPRTFICRHCGKIQREKYAVKVYVDPADVRVVRGDLDADEARDFCRKHYPISNLCIIGGTICRQPTESHFSHNAEDPSHDRLQMQLASRRMRRIVEDGPEKTTDYPWMKVSGENCEELYDNINIGTSMLSRGAVQTRMVEDLYSTTCENCGETITKDGLAVEVYANDVDVYRNSEREYTQSVNIAIAFGLIDSIHINTDEDGNITSARMVLYTIRRTFATSSLDIRYNPVYDTPVIYSEDPEFIRKHMVPLRHKDLVFIYGHIEARRMKSVFRCPDCNELHREPVSSYLYISPECVCPFFEDRDLTLDEKMQMIRSCSKFSHQVYIEGTLVQSPKESDFIHYGPESDRRSDIFSFKIDSAALYQTDPNKPALPTIKVYGNRAYDTKQRVTLGSSVYINAGIQSRERPPIRCKCGRTLCNETAEITMFAYNIDPQKDCLFPEKPSSEEKEGSDAPYIIVKQK